MIKKFISSVLMACSLLLAAATLTPQSAQAVGGCVFYWMPQTIFFQAGGYVVVIPKNGNEYTVDASTVVPGAQYTLASGDNIVVYPPDCATWYWGWTYFGPCNSQGGVTIGPAHPVATSGVHWIHSLVYVDCNCPNGSSDAGLQYVFAAYCEASPPPPQ